MCFVFSAVISAECLFKKYNKWFMMRLKLKKKDSFSQFVLSILHSQLTAFLPVGGLRLIHSWMHPLNFTSTFTSEYFTIGVTASVDLTSSSQRHITPSRLTLTLSGLVLVFRQIVFMILFCIVSLKLDSVRYSFMSHQYVVNICHPSL